MKYATALYDTNIYISYPHITREHPAGWFSSVVLAERLSSAGDKSRIKELLLFQQAYQAEDRFLVPNDEAWVQAGLILNHYLNDLSRSNKQRHRPADRNEEQTYNVIRDILIAVSAKQNRVTVVSDNKDFVTIAKYYKFRHKTAEQFFG